MTTLQQTDESILIPAGHDPASYACVRSLGRRGINTIVASETHMPTAAGSRFCGETVILPSPESDIFAYRDALLELAARSGVRTIVPVRPVDAYLLSRYEELFEEHVSLVVPSFELLRKVFDRMELFEAATEAGVPVPETRLLDDRDALEACNHDAVVKSRYNLLTADFVDPFPQNETATVKTVKYIVAGQRLDPAAIREEMRHTPIVQEYVHHTERYVYGALYDHGEPRATFQHRQIRGNSYTGGGGVYRTSTDIPELERVGRALLDHLEWHGLACIEFMRDDTTGEFVLAEINPRLWQSLPTAVRAGADFPYYYWQQATGQGGTYPKYKVGVSSHLLYGEIGYLRSVLSDASPFVDRPSFPRTAADVLWSCLVDPHFDIFRLDDPFPAVRGLVNMIR